MSRPGADRFSAGVRRDIGEVRVVDALMSHFDAFLTLASQVEHWFGPMVEEAGFHRAVAKNIDRGSALVALDEAGQVRGGLLFSHHAAPEYSIGWLVVDETSRSAGVGQILLAEAFRRWVRPPAEVSVVTFGSDHPGARSRRFYERLGFHAVEIVDPGPEGGSRERFCLTIAELPDWSR
jgi:GNAT superfamily N-acetyltransferase